MKKSLIFPVLCFAILISSCAKSQYLSTPIDISQSQEELIYCGYKAYLDYRSDQGIPSKQLDTIYYRSKTYFPVNLFYDEMNFLFYTEFFVKDSMYSSNLGTQKEKLAYFESIQKVVDVEVEIPSMTIEIEDQKRLVLPVQEGVGYMSFTTVFPTIKENHYRMGITGHEMTRFIFSSEKCKVVGEPSYEYMGASLVPYYVPDTLRSIDFEMLREKLGIKY